MSETARLVIFAALLVDMAVREADSFIGQFFLAVIDLLHITCAVLQAC